MKFNIIPSMISTEYVTSTTPLIRLREKTEKIVETLQFDRRQVKVDVSYSMLTE